MKLRAERNAALAAPAEITMLHRHQNRNWFARTLVAAMLVLVPATFAAACPFCSVESRTLTEELTSSEAVVLAKLVADAPPFSSDADFDDPDSGKAMFQIVDVLRHGEGATATALKAGDEIKVVYFGEDERDKTFMISGIAIEDGLLEWTTPLPLSAAAVDYVRQLPDVPTEGGARLEFFEKYLENDDPLLAQDSYDEFARAPYSALQELKDKMRREKLVEWIQSADVNPSRRRLYLTMLGVCGDQRDLPMLEQMIVSDYSVKKPILEQMVSWGRVLQGPQGLDMLVEMVDLEERQKKLGLDATIGCYLVLRGPEALDLIDERFLKNPKVEYTHAYMSIMALRIIGEETHAVPRERLLQSMRLLLDNPEFADQVIPDLARWEDWSVLERLTKMYKKGDEKSYVRQPIVTYLTVASEQPGDVGTRAKAALAELEQLDPEGVKKARSLMAFGFLARARSAAATTGAQRPEGTAESDATSSEATKQSEPADEPPAGFQASAAERATENEDASQIPQPPGYVEVPGEEADEALDTSEEPLEDASEEAEEVVVETVSSVESPPELKTFSRPLVIAVPLAAAAVLMSIYWLILRWGAM
jgi:hypothetical protein